MRDASGEGDFRWRSTNRVQRLVVRRGQDRDGIARVALQFVRDPGSSHSQAIRWDCDLPK